MASRPHRLLFATSVLACAACLGVTGCPSSVDVSSGGAPSGGSGGSATSTGGTTTSTGGTTTSSGGGGASSGCPVEQPGFGGDTACTDEGLSCSYGQECCCGNCYSSFECDCSGGQFSCYYTDACLAPPCEQDACPGFEGEIRYVQVTVNGVQSSLYDPCFMDPSGPLAFSFGNGKTGESYFRIEGCGPGMNFNQGPSVLMKIDIPFNMDVMAPYSQTAETTYVAPDGTAYAPSKLTTGTVDQFGAVHELVKGTLKGSVTSPDGTEDSIDVQFTVCRRENQISL